MNLRGIVIGVAIFILTTFVAIYGISVVFPQPQYEDYCNPIKTAEVIDNAQRCIDVGGLWTPYDSSVPRQDRYTGYCDRDYTCRMEYQNASEENSKKRFIASIPIGIAIIVFGNGVFALETVGVGLMAGGAGTFVWGAGSYWGYANDLWRFIISLFGLIVLIWFAYWFEKRNKKKGLLKNLFRGKKKKRKR